MINNGKDLVFDEQHYDVGDYGFDLGMPIGPDGE